MLSEEFSTLFERDLNKVILQIKAFPDEGQLWTIAPGITNSAGNLVLHLEGNLREYVGRQLGGIAYIRQRPQEFAERCVPSNDLVQRIESVKEIVPAVIRSLTVDQLNVNYPENVLGYPMTAQYFLIHLHGHLNYHLGQIDYLRRILTKAGAI